MDKIIIGKIVNVVGLKGEVKVYNYAENQKRYESLDRIYLGSDDSISEFHIEKVRYKDHMVILKLHGINDRNSAEHLRDLHVMMSEEDLEELPEGVFYIKDMIGMNVVSEEGEFLGTLDDVLTNTPQRVYVVGREGKKDILIPGVDEFIREISIEKRQITVRLIEGLYED